MADTQAVADEIHGDLHMQHLVQEDARRIVGMLDTHAGQRPPGCTCQDQLLCARIKAVHEKEFFGFMWPPSKAFKQYNFTRLTSVAWQEDPELVCLAHSHGVRVIMNGGEADKVLGNKTAGMQWVHTTVQHILDHSLDGVNFDYEQPLSRPSQLSQRRAALSQPAGTAHQPVQAAGSSALHWGSERGSAAAALHGTGRSQPGLPRHGGSKTHDGGSPTAHDYTWLVATTAAVLRMVAPEAQVSVDIPWSPYDVDRRNYDWRGLAASADLLFVMAYDMQSQIWGRCVASANDPLALVERGLSQWVHLEGLPASKLVLGVPWYGYDYPCERDAAGREPQPDQDVCLLRPVPFQGAPCSDAAGPQRPYAEILQMLRQGRNTTAVKMDPLSHSPTFNYRADDGGIHQVWFDCPQSLALRYQLAAAMGLRGIGSWNIELLYQPTPDTATSAEIQAMWGAVDTFFGST